MMYLKPGVKFVGVSPSVCVAMLVSAAVFSDLGQRFTVTSVCDGEHMAGSRHFDGLAFDIRIRDLRGILPQVLAYRLQEALGDEFQVLNEPDHIHVEVA